MGINVTDILGGGVLDGVSKIISQFKGSPEDKAKLQQLVESNTAQFKVQELEAQIKLNDIAGQNIRADAGSQSWMARNCRPLFIVAGTCLICFNFSVPLIAQLAHMPLQPLPLPDWFWQTFTAGFLGYATGRSIEKVMNADK